MSFHHSSRGILKKRRRRSSALGSATFLLLATLLWTAPTFLSPAPLVARRGLRSAALENDDSLRRRSAAVPGSALQPAATATSMLSSTSSPGSPIQPLGSYVLVAPKAPESSTSGIVLTRASQELPTEGVVIAAGPGDRDEAASTIEDMWVSVGQNVKFHSFGAEPVSWGDEEWLLLRQSSVILTFAGDAPTPDNVKLPPGKLLLKLDEVQAQTTGGIIASQASQAAADPVGVVVALADDLREDPYVSIGRKIKCRPSREAYEVKMADGSKCMQVDLKDALAIWSE